MEIAHGNDFIIFRFHSKAQKYLLDFLSEKVINKSPTKGY